MASVLGSLGALNLGATPAIVPSPEPSSPPAPHVNLGQSEQEIARLTWLVLDGKASAVDRQRLAELVSAQHTRRHGPGR